MRGRHGCRAVGGLWQSVAVVVRAMMPVGVCRWEDQW
jgi:hypothetical protein